MIFNMLNLLGIVNYLDVQISGKINASVNKGKDGRILCSDLGQDPRV